jgi:hypothetical protein
MIFTIDKFLKPNNPGQNNIVIFDDNGRAIHTINPYSVVNTLVSNNLLKISLTSDRVLTLNFVTNDFAKTALNLIQQRLEIYKNQNPLFIDKQVEKYVDDVIDKQKKVIDNIVQSANGNVGYIPRWISATSLSGTSSIWNDGKFVRIGFTASKGLLNNSGTGLLNIQTDLTLPATFSLLNDDYSDSVYGPTNSALLIEGVHGGLSTPAIIKSPGGGFPVSWFDDIQPLARIVGSGYGTALKVESISPYLLSGQLVNPPTRTGRLVSGPSVVTHFKGADPVYIWEHTNNKRLRLESTGGRWDFWSEAIIPGVSNEISFQNSSTGWELIVSATAATGSTVLPHTKPEYAVNATGYSISGDSYTTYSLVPKAEISDIITFSSDFYLAQGQIITGTTVRSGTSRNIFQNNTRIDFIFEDRKTVKLSLPVALTFSTTDPITVSGPIFPNTQILGAQLNNTGTNYFGSKLSTGLLRQVVPGEKVFIQARKGTVFFAGGVGIGTGNRGNIFSLTVNGLSNFTSLQSGALKLIPNITRDSQIFTNGVTSSNVNVLVGDIYGDSKWVPATNVFGSGFSGTSSTPITIGNIGSYFQISTQPFLSFRPGQVVVLYDELEALYPDPNYQNGFGSKKIIAEIDGYNFNSGTMSLVTLYSQSVGSQSDSWSIQLSGAVGPQGPAGFNQGTFSVTGDIIPALDYTYNLGSTTSRWNNIYVKDALVASQSLYLGDVKLSVTDDGNINIGNRAINRYNGTSSTPYTIGVVGDYVTLTTNKYLTYVQNENVKVENRVKSNFEEDGYSEESIYGFYKGTIDTYDPDTGIINLVITFTEHTGFQSDTWLLDIDVPNLGFEATLKQDLSGVKLAGTSETSFSIPSVGQFREITTQMNLGFHAGQNVIVYNELPNNYEDDEYSEGNGQYFIGRVDFYYPDTGILSVVSEYSQGSGTYSNWTITVSSNPLIDEIRGGTLSNNLYIDGHGYDLIGVEFDNITFTSSVFDIVSNFVSLDSTENIQILADNDITIFGSGQVMLPGHTVFQQTSEVLNSQVNATSSVLVYDFSTSQNWYHSTIDQNFNANFINLPLTNDRIIKAKIIIPQGATAYGPSNLLIDGITQSIRWKSGTYSLTPNNLDIIDFNFVRTGNFWYQVYGEINTFI